MSVSPAAELLRYRQTRIDSVGRKENTPYASVHLFTNIFITESRRFMYLCGFQLLAVTKSRTETWELRLGDVGLGDVGLGDVGLGDVGLGDVRLGDVGRGDLETWESETWDSETWDSETWDSETWDSGTRNAGTRGRVETRERDKQVVICWRACQ